MEEKISRLEGVVTEMSKRLEDLRNDMNHRFTEMSKRFEDLRNDMSHRFAETSKRMDDVRSDMNFRFNILLALNICILGAILGVLFKLIFS